jgi:hypothetical protein
MALTCFCAAALPYLRGQSPKCDEKNKGREGGGKTGEGEAETTMHMHTLDHTYDNNGARA